MNKKIQNFMLGRNGIDEFNKFLLKVYLFILIINIFLRSTIIDIIGIFLLITILFRMLSKKQYQRVRENRLFVEIHSKVINNIRQFKVRFINRGTNIYKKCPKCKTMLKLKLPKKRGIKHTTCPQCHNRFAFICLRKK